MPWLFSLIGVWGLMGLIVFTFIALRQVYYHLVYGDPLMPEIHDMELAKKLNVRWTTAMSWALLLGVSIVAWPFVVHIWLKPD